MSPRRPHLRNRKNIKAPSRYKDADNTSSPLRQESNEELEESSGLDEEIYESSKPRKPKIKRPAYHGKVTEFNPNLPPAAFPTLDHPDYVHNGGNVAIDVESHLLGFHTRERKLSGSEAIDPASLDRGCRPETIDLTGDLPAKTSATADLAHRGSRGALQNSITVQKQPQGTMLSSMYGEPTDNGPRNPIWASNMARMAEAGRTSDLDRIMLEMESSDEEDAAARPTNLTSTASSLVLPAWDDLTVAHKLDLVDSITELYPDLTQVMYQLRLSPSQKEGLSELLTKRQDRVAREEANQQRLQKQTKEVLLHGGPLSQSTFHQMVEESLYGNINENDHLQTNLMELKRARAYLKYCGFNPALADSSWDVPSISNGRSSKNQRPAQEKTKASLSSIDAQIPPNPSEGPFSRWPTLFTSSPISPYLPDPRFELEQQFTQGVQSQHRPYPANALIAQHSPAAPLSKVPLQSFRVAATSSRGDLRARYQGTTRTSRPGLSALQAQSNASTETDRRATNKALPKASGAISLPPNPQKENSLRVNLHALAPKGLPIAPWNQDRQSSAGSNAGGCAPPGKIPNIEISDHTNKKKRKKSAV